MYRIEWIERRKLASGQISSSSAVRVSPVVLSLGFTSLLTDISSEMVNSVLPVYLVLHLHLSPVQYGVVDGIYNGLAIAILSLLAGFLADRVRRQKEVALAGYGFSAICKLLLLAAGGVWSWLLIIIGIDRAGKGIRSAPRDALISLNTRPEFLASAFSVHRAMDACGSLLGPIVAFVLLAQLPGAYDALWVTSFVFAILGIAVLWLFVPHSSPPPRRTSTAASPPARWSPWKSRQFVALVGCGALLAATTISDGFIYLLLQKKSGAATGFFPLFYVLTAASYMLFSIPAGRLADRLGRANILLAGYALLGALYLLIFLLDTISIPLLIGSLVLLGLYYSGTEGILMAMAGAIVPADRRTSGLAILATAVGLAKMLSSVVFGWLWESHGIASAIVVFAAALAMTLLTSLLWLKATQHHA